MAVLDLAVAASVDSAAKVAVQGLEAASSAATVVWAALEAVAPVVDLEADMVVPVGLVD